MNRHAFITSAAAGLLTLLGATAAVAANGELSAHVPFAFTAGTTAVSAGTYTVERLTTQQIVLLRGSRHAVFVLAQSAETAAPGKPTRLVFHRYRDRYFLRQVWFQGTRGYALPETREERQTAERGRRRMALRPVVVDVVASLS